VRSSPARASPPRLEHGELVVELDDAVAEAAGVGLESSDRLREGGELAARFLRERLEQVSVARPRATSVSRGMPSAGLSAFLRPSDASFAMRAPHLLFQKAMARAAIGGRGGRRTTRRPGPRCDREPTSDGNRTLSLRNSLSAREVTHPVQAGTESEHRRDFRKPILRYAPTPTAAERRTSTMRITRLNAGEL
jgi:hypothetical protein